MQSLKIFIIDPSHFTFPYDHHLAQALANRGHEVMLVGRQFRANEERPDMQYMHAPVFYALSERLMVLQGRNLLILVVKGIEHIFNVIHCYRLIIKQKPDIIHVQWSPLPWIDGFMLRCIRSIPILYTIHDSNLFHNEQASWLQRVGYRKFLNHAEAIIFHTHFSKNEFFGNEYSKEVDRIQERKLIFQQLIAVIPHGILSSFCRRPQYGPDKTVWIPHEKIKRIVFFGTLKKYKGIETLIRAFGSIPPDVRKDAELVIAGEARTSLGRLIALAREVDISSKCQFIPRRLSECEIDDLLHGAWLVVFPHSECDVSGALLRALPFGKPIIASRVGGFVDLFEPLLSHHLFPSGDYKKLGELMSALLSNDDLYKNFVERTIALNDRISSWDQIANMTEELYLRCINKQ